VPWVKVDEYPWKMPFLPKNCYIKPFGRDEETGHPLFATGNWGYPGIPPSWQFKNPGMVPPDTILRVILLIL
jgi:hypothetical protein